MVPCEALDSHYISGPHLAAHVAMTVRAAKQSQLQMLNMAWRAEGVSPAHADSRLGASTACIGKWRTTSWTFTPTVLAASGGVMRHRAGGQHTASPSRSERSGAGHPRQGSCDDPNIHQGLLIHNVFHLHSYTPVLAMMLTLASAL